LYQGIFFFLRVPVFAEAAEETLCSEEAVLFFAAVVFLLYGFLLFGSIFASPSQIFPAFWQVLIISTPLLLICCSFYGIFTDLSSNVRR